MARNSVARGFFWPLEQGSSKAFGPSASLCCKWGASHSSFLRWPRASFDWQKGERMAFLLLGVLSLQSSAVKGWSLDSVPLTAPSCCRLEEDRLKAFPSPGETSSRLLRYFGPEHRGSVWNTVFQIHHTLYYGIARTIRIVFTPLPSPSKKEEGKERKGKKVLKMQNQNVRKKNVTLFGKASRGTWPGSLVLLTEEGAKAARTESGFQVKKRRGWQWEGAEWRAEHSGCTREASPKHCYESRHCPQELGLQLPLSSG